MTGSRRRGRTVRALLLGVVVTVIAGGCTPPGLPPPLAPSGAPSVSGVAPDGGSVIVGVDGVPTGFNPHAIADYSPAARAVDALVLPSVSRVRPDGSTALDRELIDSATVTSTDPFTVTYRLARASSWSDGTPITAEDFRYLSAALQSQPGTVDAAGYALITSIRGLDAGKTVQVRFARPFPAWATLFSPLLPAHIMKDSPGGWAGALATGLPVSGGRYKMTDYDTTSSQITLTRNDKYWLPQRGPATVVLRIGAPEPLLAALDRANVQAALLGPAGLPPGRLGPAVPAARRAQVAEPGAVQLVFDTRTGPTAESAVRQAIAQGLDSTPIRAALAGGTGDAVAAVEEMTGWPGGPDPAPAAPLAAGRPDAAVAALLRAGWTRQGAYLSRNGMVLRLLLSYPIGDDQLAAAAREVQRQLGDLGIEVDLQRLDPDKLTDTLLAGRTALALLFVPRGRSDALAAQSSFGCPTPVVKPETAAVSTPPQSSHSPPAPPGLPDPATPGPATPGPTAPGLNPSAPGPATPGLSVSSPSVPDPSSPAPSATAAVGSTPPNAGAGAVQVRTGNLSGFCDPRVDADLTAALAGPPGAPAAERALAAAETSLRSALPVLPLGRPALSFLVSARLTRALSDVGPGSPFASPLAGMSDWPPR